MAFTMCGPRPRAWKLTWVSGRDGAELLHQREAVELRPDVGDAAVFEAVEGHALDPDRLAGGGGAHQRLLLGGRHGPACGHGGSPRGVVGGRGWGACGAGRGGRPGGGGGGAAGPARGRGRAGPRSRRGRGWVDG